MEMSRRSIYLLLLGLAFAAAGTRVATAPAAPAAGQNPAEQPATAAGVITAETKLVLVDVIATDKKGSYIQDLGAKDFRVYEDDKEQAIASFSRAADPREAGGTPQPRYMVLFFDNASMSPADQVQARDAAARFVEKAASSEHLLAVADFSGTFHLVQNFTSNVATLKRAVGGVKFSSLQPNEPGQTTQIASLGAPSMIQVRSDFAVRSVLLAMRNLFKSLRPIPGRKIVVMFSAGFQLTPERESELTATIDAANKANVAIYPVDVRGLQGLAPGTPPDMMEQPGQRPGFPPGAGAYLIEPGFAQEPILLASLMWFPVPLPQRPPPGGGGGGGGGGPGGGGGGGRGGGGGGGGAPPGGGGGGAPPGGGGGGGGRGGGGGNAPPGGGTRGGPPSGRPYNPLDPNSPGNPNFQPRAIIPPMADNVTANQQVLHALAAGTGGETIFNTNDLLAGLMKIGQELDEYYILGYAPPDRVHDGSYHQIAVKVERKGVKIRARNGYYDLKGQDLLAGKPEGKVLEEVAADPQPGSIPVSLTASYFYTGPQVARVNFASEIPAGNLDFQKDKGKFHAEVNVLGVAMRDDNSVAARFSDTVKLDLEKNDLKDFTKGTYAYQNTFNIAPGKYRFKLVLSAGGKRFAKYETPLEIEPFDGTRFHLSGIALANRFQPVSQMAANLDVALLEERSPLVAQDLEIIPSPNNRFPRKDKVAVYVEVYEPLLLTANVPRVGIICNVFDRKSNQQVFTSNTVLVNSFALPNNPVIPVLWRLPVEQFQAGDYRLEVRARDAAGNASPLHSVEFTVE